MLPGLKGAKALAFATDPSTLLRTGSRDGEPIQPTRLNAPGLTPPGIIEPLPGIGIEVLGHDVDIVEKAALPAVSSASGAARRKRPADLLQMLKP